MGYITWFEGLETGIKEIDEQHKILISILNELYENLQKGAVSDQVDEILKKLKDYTDYHFKTEEMMMRKINFPYLTFHLNEHKNFLSKLIELVENKASTTSFKLEILLFLRDWLVKHIIASDRKIKKYLDY